MPTETKTQAPVLAPFRAGTQPTYKPSGYSQVNALTTPYGTTTFSYDAAGNRVQRTDSSSQSTRTTTFVYDAFGNLAADYGAPSGATTGTQYVAVDAMGSTRLVTGGSAVERHDFEPYGAELSGGWRTPALGYGSATVRQRFTGQERDDETTLDYFLARYYSGTQGRFGSPDPGNAGANPADPQSWNGYAYVSGNPLTYTDPSGLQAGGGGDMAGGGGGDSGVPGAIIAGLEFLGLGRRPFGGNCSCRTEQRRLHGHNTAGSLNGQSHNLSEYRSVCRIECGIYHPSAVVMEEHQNN